MSVAIRRSGSSGSYFSRPGDDSLFDITGNITLMTWLKPNSVPGGGEEHVIMSKDTDTGAQAAYLLDISGSDKLRFRRSTSGTSFGTSLSGATSLVAGTWYFCVGWWDGTNQKVYLNAAQDATTGSTSATFNSSEKFLVGDRGSLEKALDSDLEDLRVYSRALTLNEIETIYRSQGHDGIVNDLVARYLFQGQNAATAGTEVDVGPNGLNLTANNSPTYSEGQLAFTRMAA